MDSVNDNDTPRIERRREVRTPHEGEARIYDCASGLDLGAGILSDISPSGAAVFVYCRLTPGTMIEVRQDDEVYRGEVRYCVERGADFRVGIQLMTP